MGAAPAPRGDTCPGLPPHNGAPSLQGPGTGLHPQPYQHPARPTSTPRLPSHTPHRPKPLTHHGLILDNGQGGPELGAPFLTLLPGARIP